MRKIKPAAFKAVRTTVTMPASFIEFTDKFSHGMSHFAQDNIARCVTGKTPEQFDGYLSDSEDVRFRRDSAWKEFIRCARWMMEGEIKEILCPKDRMGMINRDDNRSIWFKVYWKLTDTTTICRIDMAEGQTFVHVCYDNCTIATEAELDKYQVVQSWNLWTTFSQWKADILRSWFTLQVPNSVMGTTNDNYMFLNNHSEG